MKNGVEVRSMEELRDNFSILKVLSYLQDGKLIIWLRDRYENDIADLIEELDLQDEGIAKKVSEIFEVPYDETELERVVEEIKKKKKFLIGSYIDSGLFEGSRVWKKRKTVEKMYKMVKNEMEELRYFWHYGNQKLEFGLFISQESLNYQMNEYYHSKILSVNAPKTKRDVCLVFLHYYEKSQNILEKYKFIFLELVDIPHTTENVEESISFICDFASILKVMNDELEDIIYVIKYIYSKVDGEYILKTELVPAALGITNKRKLCDECHDRWKLMINGWRFLYER